MAWIRAESLPPWNDFMKGREPHMLRMHNSFVDIFWRKHRKTMEQHTATATQGDEDRAFDV